MSKDDIDLRKHMEVPRPPQREIHHVKMDDIKPRRKKSTFHRFFGKKEAVQENFQAMNSRALPHGIIWGIVGLIVLFIGGCFFLFYSARQKATGIVSSRLGSLEAGAQDLQNFDLTGAEREFSASNQGLLPSLKSALGAFGFLFNAGGPLHSFADISSRLATLSGELNGMESDFFTFFSTGNGKDLVGELSNLRDTLHAVDSESQDVAGALSSVGQSFSSGVDLLSLETQVKGAANFLDVFVPWFSAPAAHHVLILFQNPSEIRPAGGFLGSYADVTLQGGNITDIAVHDIADADMTFKENIVPPKQLQAEVSRWRPADTNWFFDFSDSASETISFFEKSDLYAASGTKFDAAIAVSPKVISDILSLTGPISVSSTKTQFDADTFLIQTQKMVQNGQANGATYPKSILKELVAAMFQKVGALGDDKKQSMIPMIANWVANKDLMVYFKDSAFESFFDSNGASGKLYSLPQNFEGDYLAIADANINGQKSDLYIAQNVDLQSQIGIDGTVSDLLTIVRKHNGNQSPYWWYSAKNNDYLQIFLPDETSLLNESGGLQKSIVVPVAYANDGYTTDPFLAGIESTYIKNFNYPAVSSHEESGKEVLSTWASVTAGSKTTVSFDYTHRLFLPPADGTAYQFIFEKQAGVDRHYTFEIMAPVGFQFAENNLPTYSYESDDMPGRLILNLTLKKVD